MNIIKRLFKYLRAYMPMFLLAILLSVSTTLLGMIHPLFIRKILDQVIPNKDIDLLMLLSGLLIVIFLVRAIILSCSGYVLATLRQKIIHDIRLDIYRHLQKLSISFYESRSTGNIMSKVTNDVEALERILVDGANAVIQAILMFICVAIVIFYLDWKLALCALCPLPIFAVITFSFTIKAHLQFREIRKKAENINIVLHEHVTGIREIKVFGQEPKELERFSEKSTEYYEANMKAAKLWAKFFPSMEMISRLSLVFVLFFGGLQAVNGALSVGSLMAFVTYLCMLYEPIHQLNMVNHMMQHARAAGERIFEIMDTNPDIVDIKNAACLHKPIRGTVEFNNVNFSYAKNRNVLHNITLFVHEGETVALVGPTGAGKTTIISLISRFYDSTGGNIYIDGVDIKKIRTSCLREQIGMVLQETFLFDDTVKENISYSKPEATDEEITNAAKAANAHEFIMGLEHGYDSMVGERGVKLSGGEKQRIAIARALLKDPRILLLDEATSSVDTQTEVLIQAALERLMKNRTCFVIAHRLSTVRNASKIIVLNKGRIVEVGKHSELLKRDTLYKKLYETQFTLLSRD